MTIRKKDHLPVFSDLSAASFPFTSQIEGKQKKGKNPFPYLSQFIPCAFHVLWNCFVLQQGKAQLPSQFHVSISPMSFSFKKQAEGLPPVFPCLFPRYSLFLSLLFWCLHSSQKRESCGGIPFAFSSGEIPNCRGLSPCLSSFLIHRERRKKMKN